VVVPDFGVDPLFLANYRYLYDEDVVDSQKQVIYSKGEPRKQYVKEMIPSTKYVRNVSSEVMFLFCHGSVRTANLKSPQPGYLSFLEPHAVSVTGQVITGNTPDSVRIWSCSAYKAWDYQLKKEVSYTTRRGNVTLSQVVCRSDLVFVLSCNTAPIIEEYSAEDDGRRKPDFVVFSRSVPTHDISFNSFLALLMTVVETRQFSGKKTFSGETACWGDVVRMIVCQVILYVAEHGKIADKFWDWLRTMGIILPGKNGRTDDEFRIKGCLHTYALTFDNELKKHDKQILRQEFQSLTLMIWNDGHGDVSRGYVNIDVHRPTADLEGLRDGTLDFRTYGRRAPPTRESSAVSTQSAHPTPMSLNMLLRQLEDLTHGA
jgi:hypothetical protein